MPCRGSIKPEPSLHRQGTTLWTARLCPPCPATGARSLPFTMVLFSGVTSASLTSAAPESVICFSPVSNVTFPRSVPLFPSLVFPCFLQVRTTVLYLPGREGLAASHFQPQPMQELRREGRAAVWGSQGRNTAPLCKPGPFWCQFSLIPWRGAAGRGVWWRRPLHAQLEDSPLAE